MIISEASLGFDSLLLRELNRETRSGLPETSFNDKILKCIEKGMAPIGESARNAILWHIEKNSQLKLSEIPSNPKLFLDALEKILGPGTPMVEKMIVRQIRSEFDIPSNIESLVEALKIARQVNK